jgi:hypothetical protein
MEKTIERNRVESWDAIKERYPDSFVLILNPEFTPTMRFTGGVFIYKHKIRKKVFDKAIELKLHGITVRYTGGKRLDDLDENLLLL